MDIDVTNITGKALVSYFPGFNVKDSDIVPYSGTNLNETFPVIVLLARAVAAMADDEPPVCPIEPVGACPAADLSLVAAIQDHCFEVFVGMDCTVGLLPGWVFCLFGGLQLAETCDDTCLAAEMLSFHTCDELLTFEAEWPSCR